MLLVNSPLVNYLQGDWTLKTTGLVNNQHATLVSKNGTLHLWTKGENLKLYLSNLQGLKGSIVLKVDGKTKATLKAPKDLVKLNHSNLLPLWSFQDLSSEEHLITLEFIDAQGINFNLAEAQSPDLNKLGKELFNQ